MTDLTNAKWRKATRSNGSGDCVEVAEIGRQVAIRDSKNPEGGVLLVTRDQFREFVEFAKGR
ncbi:DUF397 domain-containing protein [Rhizomonospora bruguierae]|uniref:DUF397 domain-containing protein n=1 Tax=Rhizomonospora bruguierae TaxID=1581705 RepID=UPI001BD0CF0A|nr:DUF397 domain-containing protein [Micromonospora sp. NBRC 107566]